MEYRRNRRANRINDKPFGFSVATVLLVSGVLIYLIALSNIGTTIAHNFIAPAFEFFEERHGSKDGIAVDTIISDKREYQLPKLTAYALQFGAFEDQINAQKQAVSLQSLGAAGYVLQDGEKYRVLGAVYVEEADAKHVQERLRTEGIECVIYPLESLQSDFLLTGTMAQIQIAESGIATVLEIFTCLLQQSIAYDSGESSASEVSAICSSYQRRLAELAGNFASTGEGDQIIEKLSKLFEIAEMSLGELVSSNGVGKSEYSASLKYATIEIADSYCSFCTDVLQT